MDEERILVSREEAEGEDFEERKRKKREGGWEFEPLKGTSGATYSIAGGPSPESDIAGYWVRKKKG